MTLLALLAALPCLYWTHGMESAPALKTAGISHLCSRIFTDFLPLRGRRCPQ